MNAPVRGPRRAALTRSPRPASRMPRGDKRYDGIGGVVRLMTCTEPTGAIMKVALTGPVAIRYPTARAAKAAREELSLASSKCRRRGDRRFERLRLLLISDELLIGTEKGLLRADAQLEHATDRIVKDFIKMEMNMMQDEYAALLERALGETHGLKLTFPSPSDVIRARRKLYKLRDQRREAGDARFELLSFVRKSPTDLLLIRRDQLPAPVSDGLLPATSPLRPAELPSRLNQPRGPGHCRSRRADRSLI